MSEESHLNEIQSLHEGVFQTAATHAKLLENYLSGRKYQLSRLLQGFPDPVDERGSEEVQSETAQSQGKQSRKRQTTSSKRNQSERNDVNDFENDSSILNNTRTKRNASKIAGLKIKKNLRIPLKLRRPSSRDVYEGQLPDDVQALMDVTNKQNTSREVNVQANNVQTIGSPIITNCSPIADTADNRENLLPAVSAALEPANVFTPPASTSAASKPMPTSLVKLRTDQFEKLAKAESADSDYTDCEDHGDNSYKICQTTRVTRAMAQNKGKTVVAASRSTVRDAAYRKNNVKRLSKSSKILMANQKKQQKLKANAEEIRRKNEERLKKAEATREATIVLRRNAEIDAQMKKEQKLKALAAEKERLHKEEEEKKAMIAKQKQLEMKERRRKDDAARLARIREIEEEHKRAEAAVKKKQDEEAENLRLKKMAQALREKQVKEKEKMITRVDPKPPLTVLTSAAMQDSTQNTTYVRNSPVVEKSRISNGFNATYAITPNRAETLLTDLENVNDYGIDALSAGDSSESEDHPRKHIPLWSRKQQRQVILHKLARVPLAIVTGLFKCDANPDVMKLMGKVKRIRTSSAVWEKTILH